MTLNFFATCFFVALVSFSAPAGQDTAKAPGAADPGWPREVTEEGSRLVYYQPQIDSWKDYQELDARVAVVVTPSVGEPAAGILKMHARTITDSEDRIVLIRDIKLVESLFPSLDQEGSTKMHALADELFPKDDIDISLDRMIAAFELNEQTNRPASIKTTPPKIFSSEEPAILLLTDGKPLRAPIQGTNLDSVLNANWDLFFDKSSSQYYLLKEAIWLSSPELDSDWTVVSKLPPDFNNLPKDERWDAVKNAVPPKGSALLKAPKVFYSEDPADLIVTTGEPDFQRIPGTGLARVVNTESVLYFAITSPQFYYLSSGRWFGAPDLEGPWRFAGTDLPADFSEIPNDPANLGVRASIPGTREAEEAVMLAQIPTVATVNRAEAEADVKVTYQGHPLFKPVEQTSLQYAINTQEKVLKAGDLYYLCFQGVWFHSAEPEGPWKTAESVPQEIYTIPPSNPTYNTTYVYIYGSTPMVVYTGYTSGYTGTFVLGTAGGFSIAYGTGWYYPPYVYWGPYRYPVYWGYPYTYGAGVRYNFYTGGYYARGVAYGPFGAAGRSAWYNPSTGFYGRGASVQTAASGRTAAQVYNPWTGTYASTRQGSSPYAQWGSSVVARGNDWVRTAHGTSSQGSIAGFRTSDGGGAVAGSNGGFVGRGSNNNLYAGKDGNVYRKTGDSWQEYDSGTWNSLEPAQPNGSREGAVGSQALLARSGSGSPLAPDRTQLSDLNREAGARQRGTAQTQRSNAQRSGLSRSAQPRGGRPRGR